MVTLYYRIKPIEVEVEGVVGVVVKGGGRVEVARAEGLWRTERTSRDIGDAKFEFSYIIYPMFIS